MGCFYHIKAVVDNAVMLAKQFGADEEIVIIAAWLHDIASITDYNLYEEHHIHGAEMAKEILETYDYDKEKIAQIQSCVLNHRGSISGERLSLEELCVADADAISHFDSVPSLLYLAYVERKMDIGEGISFVKQKLERSYNKLSDRSVFLLEESQKELIESIETYWYDFGFETEAEWEECKQELLGLSSFDAGNEYTFFNRVQEIIPDIDSDSIYIEMDYPYQAKLIVNWFIKYLQPKIKEEFAKES